MNAPELIWAQDAEPAECNFIGGGWWNDDIGSHQPPHTVEYIRKDISDARYDKLEAALLSQMRASADYRDMLKGIARNIDKMLKPVGESE